MHLKTAISFFIYIYIPQEVDNIHSHPQKRTYFVHRNSRVQNHIIFQLMLFQRKRRHWGRELEKIVTLSYIIYRDILEREKERKRENTSDVIE